MKEKQAEQVTQQETESCKKDSRKQKAVKKQSEKRKGILPEIRMNALHIIYDL